MDLQLPDIQSQFIIPETARTGGRGGLRFPLVWPVYLWTSADALPIVGKTVSVSSDSFYCVVPQQIQCDIRMFCHIVIPSRYDSLALKCNVYVIRSEKSSKIRQFGIECMIEQYSVVRWSELRRSSGPQGL